MITSGKNIRILLLIVLGWTTGLGGCAGPSRVQKPADVGPPPEIFNEAAFHHFSNGAILMLDRNYSAAAKELEKALSYEPNSREIRASLGECYFRLNELDKAVAVVGAISPKDSKNWGQLANYYRHQNRSEETYNAYREVLRLDSNEVDAYWYLVQMEMRRGQRETAVELMKKLVEIRLSVRMMTELGRVYWQAGQPEKAIETLNNVVEGVYGSPQVDAFGLLADIYSQRGESPETVQILQKARTLFPEHPRLLDKVVDALIDAGNYDEAADELLALVQQTSRPKDRIRLAALYFDNLGRYDDADSLFTIAAKTDPDNYILHYYLGRLKMMRQQFDSAKVHLARAVEIDDEKPNAYYFWANALMAQDSTRQAIAVAREGEFIAQPKGLLQYVIGIAHSRLEVYDTTIFWLEKSLHTEPSNLRARFSLGAAYERTGRFDDADSMFQSVIAVDSNHAQSLNYLGYMYAERGINLETSLRLIERALQIDPDNAAYLDSYAWVLFKLGRHDEAEEQIHKAVEHATQEDPVIYDHFGDILLQLGSIKEARKQWTKALELDPDNAAIKEKLESDGP